METKQGSVLGRKFIAVNGGSAEELEAHLRSERFTPMTSHDLMLAILDSIKTGRHYEFWSNTSFFTADRIDYGEKSLYLGHIVLQSNIGKNYQNGKQSIVFGDSLDKQFLLTHLARGDTKLLEEYRQAMHEERRKFLRQYVQERVDKMNIEVMSVHTPSSYQTNDGVHYIHMHGAPGSSDIFAYTLTGTVFWFAGVSNGALKDSSLEERTALLTQTK